MAPIKKGEGRIESGHRLSHPLHGEEVFISGISGFFPDSDSVKHLEENLFNKVDLISGNDRRWKDVNSEIPHRTGKLNLINKFDASFFGVHYKQSHTMDPMSRMLLEKAYESIIDAGMNPAELRDTTTGVFVGACFSESERILCYDKLHSNDFGVVGGGLKRWVLRSRQNDFARKFDISVDTVRQTLHKQGIHHPKPAKKPSLSEVHK